MPKFIVRIDLHEANLQSSVNDALQATLERLGFSRTIKNATATYWLPSAEYCYSRGKSAEQVRAIADAAIKTLVPKRDGTAWNAGILVMEAEGCVWSGLKEVQNQLESAKHPRAPSPNL